MKKLFSTVVLLLICNILNAQILEWRLAGNTSTTPGTDYFGTTDAKSVVFKTNSSERMRLLSTGELGIGVTAPVAWLQVKSTGTKETFRTDVPQELHSKFQMKLEMQKSFSPQQRVQLSILR